MFWPWGRGVEARSRMVMWGFSFAGWEGLERRKVAKGVPAMPQPTMRTERGAIGLCDGVEELIREDVWYRMV